MFIDSSITSNIYNKFKSSTILYCVSGCVNIYELFIFIYIYMGQSDERGLMSAFFHFEIIVIKYKYKKMLFLL